MLQKLIFVIPMIFALTFTGCSQTEKTPDAPAPTTPTPEKQEANQPQTPAPSSQWTYEGESGPLYWGDLDAKYQTCKTGTRQSPINLIWQKPTKQSLLRFHFQDTPSRVVNNGHTIQVNFDGENIFILHGEPYRLLQIHFHSTSEHTLSAKSFPMEMHMVHKNDRGELAVVGVMINAGAAHPLINDVWKNTSGVKNEASVPFYLNPKSLLPTKTTHYQYMGSLTTPPCSENVRWVVLNTPITLSQKQILFFRSFFPMNNRPVQPLNGRTVRNY